MRIGARAAVRLLAPVWMLTACGTADDSGARAAAASPSPASSSASNAAVGTPSPTPTRNLEYDNLSDLRDAAVAAGFKCEDWTQDDKVTLAAESGSCSDDDVFATYVTDADLQDQVDTYKENNKLFSQNGLDPAPTLVGPNWTINDSHEQALLDLQDEIGGKILR